MKSNNKIAGVGFLTAIAASLCCITPVIALVAGSSGIASSFSWLEPARPYLIVFTVMFLGFAWYQKLKPVKNAECNCETKKTNGFMKSTLFLGIITLFSILMLTFPYYSDAFYSIENTASKIDSNNVQKSAFIIEGMTCKSCEKHVSQEILQINGIGLVNVSYDDGNAVVEFDKTQTNHQEITEAINSTGYSVIETKKQ